MSIGAQHVMFALGRLLSTSNHFAKVVLALALLQLAIGCAFVPACLSIDEVTHRWMAHSLFYDRSLTVQNGFELFPSPALESMAIRALQGRLVAAYPYGFELLALPLYALVGYRAFIALNTVAFFGTTFLCHAVARRVLESRGGALAAAAIFALCTYAWEYSFAAWPHASTVFLSTAAFHSALIATQRKARSGRWYFLAGILAGLSATLRLDGVFSVAPLLLLVVLCAEARARSGAFVLLGAVPGLALLSVTNRSKFGSWAPLSYGPWENRGAPTSGVAAYLPLALLAAAGLTLLFFVFALKRRQRVSPATVTALLACVLGVALTIPSLRRTLTHTVDGLWMLVVDLRHGDPTAPEPALVRSARGAMIYAGSLKKAWLQSLPYLPVAIVALTARGRDPLRCRRLLAVAAAVATYVVGFAYFHWHGGLCLNLRYYLPALPFSSILAAEGLRRLLVRGGPGMRALRWMDLVVIGATLAFLVALLVFKPHLSAVALQERFYLDAPLGLAALLALALAGAHVARRPATRRAAAGASLGLALTGMVWASLTAFTYDAVRTGQMRAYNRRIAARARPYVPGNALLLVDRVDELSDFIEDGAILAQATRDGFPDAPELVATMACRGRSARAVAHRPGWDALSRALGARVAASILYERDDLVVAKLAPVSSRCD